LFYCVVFLTPLSMSLSDMGIDFSDVNMAFPTEPILFGLMILTILKIVFYPSLFKQVFQHRVTFFIILYLFWILVTCITSSMPIVSIKLLLTRLWYIVPVFFIGSLLFQNKKNVDYFILSYLIPLTIVVIYTVTRHSGYLFDKESAHYMMSPFFNDHTSYGAMIAFFLPLSIAFFWIKKHNIFFSFFMISIILILTIGLILSFTRAAWISLFISVIVGLFLKFKINKTLLYSLPILGFVFLLSFQNPILNLLESNRQDSSDNLIEHITSLSNISTDASNMERINRWKCAL
jgi:putative inorganic carbon (HCO3(-)) transporter